MSLEILEQQARPAISAGDEQFYTDVIEGLSSKEKQLPSKYFYDAAGDKLFQDIMASPDYYLTRCEMEIFRTQISGLIHAVAPGTDHFNLVELGPGDCTKSIHLLRGLLNAQKSFTYVPIDISTNVLNQLEQHLPEALPDLNMKPLNGDYFEMLDQIAGLEQGRRVVLCLGANIGNMPPEDCSSFCRQLRDHLSPGDILVVGFDLKKNPIVVQAAYDDRDGITRAFNLNLLKRMNNALYADFDLESFAHYAHYDPETGASKSYLVSLKDQSVHFPGHTIHFKNEECIWMEISQKYTLEQVDEMATSNGFRPSGHLLDSRHWFTDAVWVAA